MKRDLGKKFNFLPHPVMMIGTFDENGKPNLMNAAWGGQYDYEEIFVSLSHHLTTDNLLKTKAFTVAFATKNTMVESDYFGIVSGNKEDKIAKANFHWHKGNYVNAPVFEEYPITLECEVSHFEDGILVGHVINMVADSEYLNEDDSINFEKLEIITYISTDHSYRVIGEKVGQAFSAGKKLK